jgi:hypothetical protein
METSATKKDVAHPIFSELQSACLFLGIHYADTSLHYANTSPRNDRKCIASLDGCHLNFFVSY